MAVYFSGASIDENGKISGGRAGDQTGKEVLTRKAYLHSKGWRVFRYPDKDVATKIGKYAKAMADNNCFGYDQSQRDTAYLKCIQADFNPAKVKENCECDCSSLVRTVVSCALKKEVPNFNTATESTILKSLGFKEVNAWSISTLQTGDICVTKSKGHTEVVSSGVEAASFYMSYTGDSDSIVTALKAVGEKDTSLTHRKQIGIANGIAGVGTVSGNTQMLNLLKAGTLKKV